jgi:hypothetical protein
MRKIELDNYLPNVTCPYCNGENAIQSSRWNVGDTLYVFQYCQRCEKAWKEEWQLTKVEIGETEEEKGELENFHWHPEDCQ